MERTYPVLSRVCIGVGVIFLCLSAYGNVRFGWSLSADLSYQWWLAAIYGGSDVAAGVLVATGATMLRNPGWRWKIGGVIALMPATVLVCLSILSTFGMMSGRIAVLSGQKAALQVDADRLAWIRGQTLNREIAKGERRMFRLEERQAAQEARKAASVVTDNQAVALSNAAAMIGVKLSTEQTQVGLTFVSSTMPMTVKFVCLGLGFFLFGARTNSARAPAEDKKTQGGSGGGDPPKLKQVHPEPPKPEPAKIRAAEPAHKVSRVASAPSQKLSAFDRAYELAIAHPHLSTRALAAVADCSQTSAQKVKQRLRSKADSIIRKHGNGGGYRPAYN